MVIKYVRTNSNLGMVSLRVTVYHCIGYNITRSCTPLNEVPSMLTQCYLDTLPEEGILPLNSQLNVWEQQ